MHKRCNSCFHTELEHLYNAPAFDHEQDRDLGLFELARCKSCHLVNTIGNSTDGIAGAYNSEYYGSASSKFLSIIESAIALTTAWRARKILRLWRKPGGNKAHPSVLDIGCGRGQLLRAFGDLGSTILGLERQEFPKDELTSEFIQVGSLSDSTYNGDKFDIVILWHVLEHLEGIDGLLGDITQHLEDNGLLIIAVPNFSSFQQSLFSKSWFHLDLPRHLVHIESDWLRRNLEIRGYTVESSGYFDPLQNTFGFIQSLLNILKPKQPNEYYKLLKHGLTFNRKDIFAIVQGTFLSALLLPFAVLENIIGVLFHRGATVQVIARLKKKQ